MSADTKPMPYVIILRIALGPLLLIQGRRARQTALRMPEAAGQRQGWIRHQGSDNTLNLLFVGDSTMAGVGVAHQEAALASRTAVEVSGLLSRSVHWQLIAKTGLKASQIPDLTKHEDLLHADVLITALGCNDVVAQTKPHQFVEAYAALIDALIPKRLTVISGLPPLHITPAIPQPLRWFFGLCAHQLDRALQRWIRTRSDVSYISLQWAADRTKLAEDRFHPGEGLYREWSHRIAHQIALDLGAACGSSLNQYTLD
jgi:lysophospholipase L1-like esterase